MRWALPSFESARFLRLPEDRRRAFSRLLNRWPTPLVVLTNDRVRLIGLDAGVNSSIPVDMPIPNGNRILLKLDHFGTFLSTGSFYDRLYPWLFLRAELAGFIHPARTRVVEGSVGNAGAAFAHVARVLGYKKRCVLLPADIYPARIRQIEKLGAEVMFSPSRVGAIGYIELLEEMLAEDWCKHGRPKKGGSALFPISKIRKIPHEPYAKFLGEVLHQLARTGLAPRIDTFVFGVGSGNTLSQVGLALKRVNQAASVICCEHQEYPFVERLLKGQIPDDIDDWPEPDWPATTIHGVPLNKLNLNLGVIDDVVSLSRQTREEGWFLVNNILGLSAGRPTGLAFGAALEIANRVEHQTILTLVFDNVGKYWEERRPIVVPYLAGDDMSDRAFTYA